MSGLYQSDKSRTHRGFNCASCPALNHSKEVKSLKTNRLAQYPAQACQLHTRHTHFKHLSEKASSHEHTFGTHPEVLQLDMSPLSCGGPAFTPWFCTHTKRQPLHHELLSPLKLAHITHFNLPVKSFPNHGVQNWPGSSVSQ